MKRISFIVIILLLLNFCSNEVYDLDNIPKKTFTTKDAKKIASFTEVGKPFGFLIYRKHLFVVFDLIVYAYNFKSFKLIKKLNKIGDGPGEFSLLHLITSFGENILLYNFRKIVFLDKSFEYIREIKIRKFGLFKTIVPLGKNLVVTEKLNSSEKYQRRYIMVDKNFKKIKTILTIPKDPYNNNSYFIRFSRVRSWNNKLYISQPQKGLYIDVFDDKGNFLYKIDKKIKKIKVNNYKLTKAEKDDERTFRMMFGKTPITRHIYLPDIKDFRVTADRIYVKTYHIKDKTEKYIIMDLKGNIIKLVFLPRTSSRTFYNNKFYYLKDNGNNETWDLYSIKL